MKGIKKGCGFVALLLLVVGCSPQQGEYLDRMAEEHKGDRPTENISISEENRSVITGREVHYATINGERVMGYLAHPEKTGEKSPGVIVIHEWWGLNNNIRNMTDKLASEGYTALAVDLYDGKVAETPDSAKTYAGSVDDGEARENLNQAYTYLTKVREVSSVGTIGWCFGGGWSLQAALSHSDEIDATVMYYGQPVTAVEELEKLHMPVLGIFGAEDSGIPPELVNKFELALNEAGVPNEIYIYEGADHAFANPSGERYEPEAAEDAWQKTVDFLSEYLN